MKKLIYLSLLLLPISSIAIANNTAAHATTAINQKATKEFTIKYTSESTDLTQKATELYRQLISFISQENEAKSFRSVSFLTQINENTKEITIKNIQFSQENSYATALQKLLKNDNDATKILEVDGVSIEANEDTKEIDLTKATTLATNFVEAVNTSNYEKGTNVSSSIDIEYHTIQ
ncbi:hypothetical protein [Myroides sp. LoEW2-1]|uniref:hypothetical protein n=1 Tax=Myroides sp. LoEW2-1 TaxID=2683192 RepID=UPI00132189F7|nr:hypothetical protein [Myroides sp. LoEW2-1]MVX35040.1 hypothetical protein [Myroides sp. LoEW2-1]